MSQLTLQLPERLAAELAEASRESNRTPDELAVDLLRRAMAAWRFERLSDKVSKSLKPDAPKSEDEAFEQLS